MTKLQVTMIGPEVSKQRPQRLGSVVISRMESKAEEAMIPSMFESGVAIIFQPGMQSNTPPWKTALSLLRDWNSLTIVTSYSHENHKTYDAVHDEDILTRYFGMNMVLSSYLNPARLANSNGVCKNCYVCAFQQGATADPEFIPWTDEQLLLERRLAFMGALVTIFSEYEGQPQAARSCKRFASDLRKGLVAVDPQVSMLDLEMQAIKYR